MANRLRNYNYKDKNVIISLFNESQSHYKNYMKKRRNVNSLMNLNS